MKLQTLGLGILILVVLVWSGCDSEQYGEPTKAGESSTVEGALPATEGAAGAGENDEGVNHYQQGHWDVAQEHFNKALATNADLPEAHYNLALALDKLGNHGEATNHFTMALNLAPEDPRIKDSGILKAHVGG